MRAVKEWIGANDNTPIPERVQVRVFAKFDGVCQCGCTRKIAAGEAWDVDHRVAIINGGANRETNLQPLLRAHHKTKTARDVREKSITYRKRKKHLGIRNAPTIRSRGFAKSPPQRSATRPIERRT
jgi:5-methylcytosine-specific restriction protein A